VTYRIEFSPEADDHIASLTARDRATLLDAVGGQLVHEPTVETGRRKPLRPNPIAEFRLRVGKLRVYYDVQEAPERRVLVKAVGLKVRDRVYVGGREVKL
jgi:mRNA-degrading endonuclease RelE of RelBE toxin-antitoxin system